MRNTVINSTSLLSRLLNVPSERAFLICPNVELTFGDVQKKVHRLQSQFEELQGKNVALVAKDRASLAVYLLAVQDMARSVYLQSSDISTETETVFYQCSDIDYRLEVKDLEVISLDCVGSSSTDTSLSCGQVILATSGTTGIPKLASYSVSSLMSTCQANIQRGEEFNWGLCYDMNRFAGLQVFLQALSSGSKLVFTDSEKIDELIDFFIRNRVNCVSATPSFWRKLLMTANHEHLLLKRITLGGEISSQSVLTALVLRFPKAKIIHIYASTEAGVGFSVKDAKEGFPLDYLNKDFSEQFQLKEKEGTLWIRTPNAKSEFIRGNIELDDEGYLNTGDLVEVREKRVFFLGRDSGSINVGGNKVMPEKVEAIIEMSDYVALSKVYAKKNSVLGSLVIADVVVLPEFETIDVSTLKSSILAVCRENLASFEVPVMIKRVDELQINATGKLVRN